MPLLEDVLKPLAVEIAYFLVDSGMMQSKVWDGYDKSESLKLIKRPNDETIWYCRPSNSRARFDMWNILAVDPDRSTIVIHPEIVLESVAKATGTQKLDNTTASNQSMTFRREFKNSAAEEKAVEAGFSLENTAKIEAGGEASQFKVSQEFKTTVSSSWRNQTSRSSEETQGGEYPVIAVPGEYVEARLTWSEQTKQRRIECDGTYGFALGMGWKQRGGWASGSPITWQDIEHLLAVAEQRGSVSHAGYDHYAKRVPDWRAMKLIRAQRLQHIDRLTDPYKGAFDIEVEIIARRPAA